LAFQSHISRFCGRFATIQTFSTQIAPTRFLGKPILTRYLVIVRIGQTARKRSIAAPPMSGAKIMHTDEEVQRAAKLAEEFNPSGVPMDDTTDLRTLAEAVDAVRTGEARVREMVARARAKGRSWGEIGIALGVSRQAARERFAERVRT
jgi:hypothetical protein